MAIARITWQDATNSSVLTTVTATYPGATTAWNLLIACVWHNTESDVATIPGFTQAIDITANVTIAGQLLYKVASGSETTITATNTSASLMEIAIYEYEWFTWTPTLDKTAVGGSVFSATASTGTTATTTASDEVAIVMADYATQTYVSWSGSFNSRNNVVNGANLNTLAVADKILASTGTQTSTITLNTTTGSIGAGIATFKWVASASNPWFISFFLS